MEGKSGKQMQKRRIVLFPIPLQGHVTPMMHLATLLHSKGFSISIIQTEYNSLDPTPYKNFTFHFLNDGLPKSSVVSSTDPTSVLFVLATNCVEPFRDCLSAILKTAAADDEPVACLISDPMWGFASSVAESFSLPRIVLRTGGISAFRVYDSLPALRKKGYFPPLKVRDLPAEAHHRILAVTVKEAKTAQAMICNTFDELEGSSIAKLRQDLPIPLFTIGPLHKYASASAASLWTQDQTSIAWLNTQAQKSVLYVSFGSVAAVTEADLVEIAWGLADSNQPFLWVVRPGLSQNTDILGEGYFEALNGRGHIVKWAPQLEVLSHPSVGGFWTHCGWNSTVESFSEGVPMLCLPFFADQAINARLLCESLNIGLQIEKDLKREEITKAITKLMTGEEGADMRNRIAVLKEKVKLSFTEGGSSYDNLEKLTNYIISL